jgi:short-subunit dehydrogenase
MATPRTILITGASSGIGAALATGYAAPKTKLALIGRDTQRLEGIGQACRAAGAAVTTAAVDVTDHGVLAAWIADYDRYQPIDLVIANAGISAQSGGRGESDEQARRIFAVNVDGVMNTVRPLIQPMSERGHGHIAIVSSLASFHGFPGTGAYCASKAAIRVWGESLYAELKPKGVQITIICPGFVTTRMTATNDFHMPLLMDAERAARIIMRGLARHRPLIAFPWSMYAAARLLASLPLAVSSPLANFMVCSRQ